MSVTLQDIASKAGGSHSSVSRALRDEVTVAPRIAQRPKRLAAEMGRLPNAVPRSLQTRQTEEKG